MSYTELEIATVYRVIKERRDMRHQIYNLAKAEIEITDNSSKKRKQPTQN